MTSPDFCLGSYSDLLRALVTAGYAFRRFDDIAPGERHLVLRHDVDQSLQAAVRIAEAEAALGITSTFFILLRTEMYNPFSRDGSRAISRIRECGHEIGLHFDPALYGPDPTAQETAIATECSILEQAHGGTVSVFSLHRPPKSQIGSADRVAGRLNAYGARFTKDIGYCSDSTGRWRYGHPLDHPSVRNGTALQLLTHPIWWYRDEPAEPQTRLESLLAERRARLDEELGENCSAYARVT